MKNIIGKKIILRSKKFKTGKLFPYIILLPALLIIGIVIAYPIINGIILSFTEYTFISPTYSWIGLKNYLNLVKDPVFGEVFFNSIFMVSISVLIQLSVGLVLALLLNTQIPFSNVFRSTIFLIWLFPFIVVTLLWMVLYSPEFSIINYMLKEIGVLTRNINWLSGIWLSKFAIIIVYAWKGIPFFMVMILAALKTVPKDLIEAAEIDGAKNYQVFLNITLPLIRNIILLACILSTVRLFQDVTVVFVLTGGGPVYATTTLGLHVYNEAFVNLNIGKAATMGVMWLVLLIFVAAYYVRLIKKQGQY
jgi:multiple sugar transport system permease protein